MTRILLIRHGTVELLGRVLYGRMPGVHLNPEGLRQSELLAQELKSRYALDAVISSPLERALETATPIAAAQQTELHVDDGLIEVDFGEWVGMSFTDLAGLESWGQYNGNRCTGSAPGGETMMDVQSRALRSLHGAAKRQPSDATLAMITHGDVIRGLLTLFLGMSLDHITRLEIAPASVSEVLLENGQPTVRRINLQFG